jgi:hypothetical protein
VLHYHIQKLKCTIKKTFFVVHNLFQMEHFIIFCTQIFIKKIVNIYDIDFLKNTLCSTYVNIFNFYREIRQPGEFLELEIIKSSKS